MKLIVLTNYLKQFAESRASLHSNTINGPNILKSNKQCTCKVNSEAFSRNQCCRGKAISIIYCEYVSAALAKLLNGCANTMGVHSIPH
jgi:hypothetical protein